MKIKLNNRMVVFIHDILVIPIAWLGAYWLRYNLTGIPVKDLYCAILFLPSVIALQIAIYWFLGVYRCAWRFASIPDLFRIIKAVFLGSLIIGVAFFLYCRMEGVPRSVLPLYALLLISLLSGSRLIYRWVKDASGYFHSAQRVLVIGAGRAGEGIVRDMLRDSTQKYQPVAFVDDDIKKIGLDIHGIRVVGQCIDIVKIVEKYFIDLIIIAIPSAPSAQMRKLVSYCEAANKPFRTLPGLKNLAAGHVSINALREVSLEDLLGRDQVSLDWELISKELKGKIVLVSGGGGSIGSELCRQIAVLQPSQLIVIENSEYNLYQLDLELREKYPDLILKIYLVDVTDNCAISRVLSQHQPCVVFHAAAYKHVPMLEFQLREAIRNNIIGTKILAEAAVKYNVKQFVLISTDKAVNPTNIMGATKRIAEIFCQNYNRYSNTRFVTVRFGNVLGSAGSVVPLFKKQIKEGGPLTVTHPEMTRFFMTIPEASQLILQAMAMGKGGEIFVLDMGEPIKISYLAEQMIRLSGRVLGEDIEIKYTGLREGEKLYEELFHESEQLLNTQHEKILLARYRELDWKNLIESLQEMLKACESYDETRLLDLLVKLVPEYKGKIPANINYSSLPKEIDIIDA